MQWAPAAVCFLGTVVLQAEVALLFVGSGFVGALWYSGACPWPRSSVSFAVGAPVVMAGAAPPATGGLIGKLSLFFLKAGALTFGGGLVIVPFLEKDLVQVYGWLDQRQFLAAVAIGMICSGPVVITATFVGYLVAGFRRSLAATVGIFLPSFLFVLIAAPLLARHRKNANVLGLVKGACAAAIGTILGAYALLGRIAIGDVLTALVALASLAALFCSKVSNPLLTAVRAGIWLLAYPVLQPTWVMVRSGERRCSIEALSSSRWP